ncbi:hypothetical protein TYRP_015576 [Tyrophagus putrescentiae]|nr:hypothetical protein TYRP_015576 [Tyrophagus putrescentiae]
MATVTNGGKNERLKEGTNKKEMLSEALMTAKIDTSRTVFLRFTLTSGGRRKEKRGQLTERLAN